MKIDAIPEDADLSCEASLLTPGVMVLHSGRWHVLATLPKAYAELKVLVDLDSGEVSAVDACALLDSVPRGVSGFHLPSRPYLKTFDPIKAVADGTLRPGDVFMSKGGGIELLVGVGGMLEPCTSALSFRDFRVHSLEDCGESWKVPEACARGHAARELYDRSTVMWRSGRTAEKARPCRTVPGWFGSVAVLVQRSAKDWFVTTEVDAEDVYETKLEAMLGAARRRVASVRQIASELMRGLDHLRLDVACIEEERGDATDATDDPLDCIAKAARGDVPSARACGDLVERLRDALGTDKQGDDE